MIFHHLCLAHYIFWYLYFSYIVYLGWPKPSSMFAYFLLARQDRQNGNLKNKQIHATKVTKIWKNEVTRMTWAKHFYCSPDATKKNVIRNPTNMMNKSLGCHSSRFRYCSFFLITFQNSQYSTGCSALVIKTFWCAGWIDLSVIL